LFSHGLIKVVIRHVDDNIEEDEAIGVSKGHLKGVTEIKRMFVGQTAWALGLQKKLFV